MVRRQLSGRGIDDERVLAAMAEVPRELFVPEELRRRAYRDGALRIGEGQTISQPWIVACMAQVLELKGPERVLEVGTGSGYAAAVLSRLCAEVVTIERFESLARQARERLAELGYENVEVCHGDGMAG
ncbi:MAG TPA: methyltransferase domain-containing protein, partial [Thermoleophilaceae bacterium]|nr:methyltransferase domain-containing protein [Thermoleophilaceae bacterium]